MKASLFEGKETSVQYSIVSFVPLLTYTNTAKQLFWHNKNNKYCIYIK